MGTHSLALGFGYVAYRLADKYEELMLTDKGEVVHKEHHAYHLKLAEDIISLFDPKEASGFLKALKKNKQDYLTL